MSRYTLGIDTSNYATSLAVFDTAGEVVCAKKRFLPVKEGQLGLRQSDALFHHTTALPEMLEELSRGRDCQFRDVSGIFMTLKSLVCIYERMWLCKQFSGKKHIVKPCSFPVESNITSGYVSGL